MIFGKKDYWSYLIITVVFITILFSVNTISKNVLLTIVGGGIGAVLGFIVAKSIVSKSTRIKSFVFSGLVLLMIASAFIVTHVDGTSYDLTGTWETDNTGDYSIRLRFNNRSVYLSTSPEFEEVEYQYTIDRDSLVLFKNNEVKFRWYLKEQSSSSLEVTSYDDELRFLKN